MRWRALLPGGPYLSVETASQPSGLPGVIGFIIGAIIGAFLAIGIDIVYAFVFTFVTVSYFGLDLVAIKQVFPAAAVGFAIVFSIGLIIGAFRHSFRAGLIFLVMRILALYIAYLTALAGIYLFEHFFLDVGATFSAPLWTPDFLALPPIDLSNAIAGAVIAKVLALITAPLSGGRG